MAAREALAARGVESGANRCLFKPWSSPGEHHADRHRPADVWRSIPADEFDQVVHRMAQLQYKYEHKGSAGGGTSHS